jgi:CspA family cold shock protein
MSDKEFRGGGRGRSWDGDRRQGGKSGRRDRDSRDHGPRDSGFGGPPRGPSDSMGFRRPTFFRAEELGPEQTATVKWFDPAKGFGFVAPVDGTPDLFLHVSVLQEAGRDQVAPGATLVVQTRPGPKGPQVGKVVSVDESTATPGGSEPRGPRDAGFGGARRSFPPRGYPARGVDVSPEDLVEIAGAVKWFNAEKDFGFAAADDGGKDIFVHGSALRRSGIDALAEGQRVVMQVAETAKGREAKSIRLA